jgi:hypothetical protein
MTVQTLQLGHNSNHNFEIRLISFLENTLIDSLLIPSVMKGERLINIFNNIRSMYLLKKFKTIRTNLIKSKTNLTTN